MRHGAVRLAIGLTILLGLAAVAYKLVRPDPPPRPRGTSGGDAASVRKDPSTATASTTPTSHDTNPQAVEGPRGAIVGRVTDAAGHPIAATVEVLKGAAVEAAPDDPFGPAMEWTHVADVRSDASGAFRLSVVPGRYLIQAWATGFAEASAETDVSEGRETPLDLRLEKGESIAGRVTDRGGAAIAGATVTATGWDDATTREAAATSGADGRYLVEGLLKGRYALLAEAEGFLGQERIDVQTGTTNADFQLDRGGRVEGRVVRASDGAPVEKASAMLRDLSEAMGMPAKEAECGPGGTFAIDGVAPGRYAVQASAEGFAEGESAPFDIALGQTVREVTVKLPLGGTLTGTVRSSRDGAPVEGATIEWVRLTDLWAATSGIATATSDAQGRFELAHLPAGRRLVRVSRDGLGETQRTVDLAEGRTSIADFLLGEDGSIYGRVAGPGGRPLAGVDVLAMGSDTVSMVNGTTDAEGRYEIPGVAAGTWEVTCSDPNGLTGAETRTIVVEAGARVAVDFDLSAGARVRGTVRQGGRPRGRLFVSIVSKPGGRSFQAETDDSGGYEVLALPQGDYVATIEFAEFPFTIPAGAGEARQDFDLPTGTLSGRVEDARSRAPIEAWIVVRRGEVTVGETASDGDGAWSVEGLGDGEYTIEASADGFARRAIGPVSLRGGQALPGQDLFLAPEARIVGTVTDAADAPVEAARVTLSDAAPGAAVPSIDVSTDDQGRFSIGMLPPGRYRGEVVSGEARATFEVDLAEGGTAEVEVSLK